MIGTDIIDLNYQDHPSRWKEERYWQKVLVEEELAWVKAQEKPFIAFLISWAIKEAAYKLVCNIDHQHRFIPKIFTINYLRGNKYYDSIYFKVNSPYGELFAELKNTATFIQAIAVFKQSDLHQAKTYSFPLSETDFRSQSFQTKKIILEHFSKNSSFDNRILEIRKKNSVPGLYISGKESQIELSISHHGHWGAFAYVDTPL